MKQYLPTHGYSQTLLGKYAEFYLAGFVYLFLILLFLGHINVFLQADPPVSAHRLTGPLLEFGYRRSVPYLQRLLLCALGAIVRSRLELLGRMLVFGGAIRCLLSVQSGGLLR